MPLYSTGNIPYPEYRAISELRRAHPELHTGNLRALIVFGGLVADGFPSDIYLLEVVDDYAGPRHVSFDSTADLPLRGQLNLYFLAPDEFEHPSRANLPGTDWSSADLLARVRPAYAILLEEPADYARSTMARWENAPGVALQAA